MEKIRKAKFLGGLALTFVALCLPATQAKAADLVASFTLPFEAQWGGAVLPAGDYVVTMSREPSTEVFTVRGEGKSAFVLALGTDQGTVSGQARLTLVSVGGRYAVEKFEIPELGMTFHYQLPKSSRRETEAANRTATLPAQIAR